LADTSDFRNGMVINYKNDLWSIVEFQHVKPGKGPAFVRTKLKAIKSGKVVDITFRSGEKVEEVRLERRDYQYLYVDGDFMTFMSLETYEQISLPKDTLGDLAKYVKESETVSMLLQEGNPLTVEPPRRSSSWSPIRIPDFAATPPRAAPSRRRWKRAWSSMSPSLSKRASS